MNRQGIKTMRKYLDKKYKELLQMLNKVKELLNISKKKINSLTEKWKNRKNRENQENTLLNHDESLFNIHQTVKT